MTILVTLKSIEVTKYWMELFIEKEKKIQTERDWEEYILNDMQKCCKFKY